MSDWCMAHPWMTFLIALAVASSFNVTIRIPTRRDRDKGGN